MIAIYVRHLYSQSSNVDEFDVIDTWLSERVVYTTSELKCQLAPPGRRFGPAHSFGLVGRVESGSDLVLGRVGLQDTLTCHLGCYVSEGAILCQPRSPNALAWTYVVVF